MTVRPKIGWILLTVSIGFALIQLDVSIVNVALPKMGSDLHASTAGLQWIVDAYALAFAALLLSAGAVGDRLGAHRAYSSGFIVFLASSLACGLAPSVGLLIGARAVQGLGAAMMLPSSLAILNHACQGDRSLRAHAVGIWTAAGGAGIAAGPLAGGLLVQAITWRSIFFVNLPLGALGWYLTARVVPPTPVKPGHDLDPAGQIFAIMALAGWTGGVIEARPMGLGSPWVLGALLVGACATAAFLRTEARKSDPMLPLRFFKLPNFSPAVLFGFLINLTYYGVVFVLSLYLQQALHYSPLQAGLAYVPLTATFVIANYTSGRLVSAFGSRLPMALGALIAAAGFGLLFPLDEHSRFLSMLAPFLLLPAGMGLAVPAMTTAILATVDRQDSGVASGVLNAARQAGGAMGVAIFGALAGGAVANIVPGLKWSALASLLLLAGAVLLAALGVRSEGGTASGPR